MNLARVGYLDRHEERELLLSIVFYRQVILSGKYFINLLYRHIVAESSDIDFPQVD